MHAVVNYLHPENNCKPVKNVYFFQVNYLCKVHLLDDTDKAFYSKMTFKGKSYAWNTSDQSFTKIH